MIYILITFLASLFFFIIHARTIFKKSALVLSIKCASVLLFGVFMARLFSNDAMNSIFNLLLIDIDTPINAPDTWIDTVGMSIFMLMLRWVGIVSLLFMVLTPFFELKRMKFIVSYVSFVTTIVSIIFFREMIYMFTLLPTIDYANLRVWEYVVELSLMLALSITHLYAQIKQKEFPDWKLILSSLSVFIIAMLALFPQSLLYNLIGYYGEIPDDFNLTHNLFILITILFPVIAYLFMRKKDQQAKDFFITLIAFAAFIQYFSYRQHGLGGLPLHLCNTAIIFMVISVVCRWRGVFYFNYFANVVGALAAILLPEISDDFFGEPAFRYYFNHWYAFAWPILAVALHTFKRPKLKDMYQAIMVLSGYYVVILWINAWFNNYSSVDYFFTYGHHITSILGLTQLQYNYVLTFQLGDLTFTFFWLYQLLFFIGFIFLMFTSWFIYDAIFQYSDGHKKLRRKQHQIKQDELMLYQLLDGRPKSEPINLGGIDMISIRNFSKKYGNSNQYAVKDFSLEVHKGEVFGFLGHNGAGKSTTIKSLVGIQSITEGDMDICGYSIKTQPLEAKLNIGYVSDNHAVYEKLTGREYINYVADLYQVSQEDRASRLTTLLEEFNLNHAIDQEIKSYSHGMKQKLVVIAALIHEPPVWILDEPLTGLDPTSAYQIKKSMKEHAEKGHIVFFSSHVIEVVEKICDRIAIITKGELQGIYDMKELREKKMSLEELYMHNVVKKAMDIDV